MTTMWSITIIALLQVVTAQAKLSPGNYTCEKPVGQAPGVFNCSGLIESISSTFNYYHGFIPIGVKDSYDLRSPDCNIIVQNTQPYSIAVSQSEVMSIIGNTLYSKCINTGLNGHYMAQDASYTISFGNAVSVNRRDNTVQASMEMSGGPSTNLRQVRVHATSKLIPGQSLEDLATAVCFDITGPAAKVADCDVIFRMMGEYFHGANGTLHFTSGAEWRIWGDSCAMRLRGNYDQLSYMLDQKDTQTVIENNLYPCLAAGRNAGLTTEFYTLEFGAGLLPNQTNSSCSAIRVALPGSKPGSRSLF